jgi:putative transposase
MPKKRHSPEQIVGKLRDADAMLSAGKTIGQACQSLAISEQTFHRWRAQYGGMKAEEAKRLKHLEEENKRLKHLLAEDRRGTAGVLGVPCPNTSTMSETVNAFFRHQ